MLRCGRYRRAATENFRPIAFASSVRALFLLVAFLVAAATGLGLTWLASASGNGFGAVRIGAWSAWPKSGTLDADPYARAAFARSGELPLGLADGLAFFAVTDDDENRLDGRCDIRIAGRLSSARFWTLTVYDTRGRLIDNAAGRYCFTSSEVVWSSDGRVEVMLGPRARSGNWLPTGGRENIVVILRLYDTPLGVGSRSSDAGEMPAIAQERCP
jgi:hypothetical protein